MARLAVNGAIVSDSGEWYYTGFKWKPLAATPTSKAPGFISPEGRQLAGLAKRSEAGRAWKQGQSIAQAGEELTRLLAQHGSLEAAERALADAEAKPANYGQRSEDGRWWWDGTQWRPIASVVESP